jgi:putative endonuclease
MFGSLRRRLTARARRITPAELGAYGEHLAARYLEKRGYRIVLANFAAPIGANREGRVVTGEIDLIAYDECDPARPSLAFIEVKTRSAATVAPPEAAVDRRKQRQIIRAARVYRRIMGVGDEPYRYDVVSIVCAEGSEPEITLRRGHFDEQTYRRGHWYARGE